MVCETDPTLSSPGVSVWGSGCNHGRKSTYTQAHGFKRSNVGEIFEH